MLMHTTTELLATSEEQVTLIVKVRKKGGRGVVVKGKRKCKMSIGGARLLLTMYLNASEVQKHQLQFAHRLI